MVLARSGLWGAPWGRGHGRGTIAFARTPAAVVEADAGSDEGVDLRRLLAVARLTPAQAVSLASDVLTEVEECDVAGAGCALDRLVVRVAGDGQAHLVRSSPPDGAAVPAGDLGPVAALLDDVRAATLSRVPENDLVTALERAVAKARLPEGRVAIVAGILRTAQARCGADARAELAELVSAASGKLPATRAARLRAPTPRPTALQHPDPEPAAARVTSRRAWAWILGVVVLVVILVTEVVFLRESITRDVRAVLDAGRSGSSSGSAAPALPPVALPAPATAGTVVGVDLRPVQRCVPGAVCTLRTQVLLRPQPGAQTVTWTFQVVDRCRGGTTTAPGGTVRLPPHAHRLDVVGSVALPARDALAVVALTGQPFRAASEPLYVPTSGVCRR